MTIIKLLPSWSFVENTGRSKNEILGIPSKFLENIYVILNFGVTLL